MPVKRLDMRVRNALAWVLLATLTLLFYVFTLRPASARLTQGYMAYYVGGALMLSGAPASALYDDPAFVAQVEARTEGRVRDNFLANPPVLALAWMPLSNISPQHARVIWSCLNSLLLCMSIAILARTLAAPQWRLCAAAAVAVLFVCSSPTRAQMIQGQMYCVLLALHVTAWCAHLTHRDRVTGAALGLAMALKLSGWPILLLLLLERRWRAAAWAGGCAAACVAASLPRTGLEVWRDLLLSRIPSIFAGPQASVSAYQDTTGFWQHLWRYDAFFNPHPVANLPALATVLTLIVTLSACVGLGRSRQPAYVRFVAAIALTELLSPVAEQYHYILVLPALAVLWFMGWERRSRALALCAALATLLINAPMAFDQYAAGWWALLAYPRLMGGWLVFASLLVSPRPAHSASTNSSAHSVAAPRLPRSHNA
jgi:hypothetical protein